MKILKLVITTVLFIAIAMLGFYVITNSRENQQFKKDSAELNDFKYGLFSVDNWKVQMSKIVSDEIDKLYLTRTNEKNLQTHLEVQLGILIDKIYKRIEDTNSKTAGGFFKQSFIESVVDIKDIKKGVPEYADAMMKELSDPKNEAQIKGLLKQKIQGYMKDTYDLKPDVLRDQIINRYAPGDEELAKSILTKNIARKSAVLTEQSLIIILLCVIVFLLEGFNKGPLPPPQYFLLTLILLVLIVVGVTTPMIDMEAKISELSFMLFDHPVVFKDQVLYYQSKSILDVFNIMINHKDIQMKLVGILMISFSIFFPVIKMMCCLAYYYDYCKARRYRIIQWFVEKSGKWSMADVLVVAMFMAFIGFNGIINTQLKKLGPEESVDMLTTNGTNLQPGFYLFFTYTVLAMFLSGFLKNRPYECSNPTT